MKSDVQTLTAPNGRVYIDAADIARICAVTVSALDRRFRPCAWGTPRDFLWQAGTGRLWLAQASLPQLVDSLFDHAQSDAAILLRSWLAPRLAAAAAENNCEAGGRGAPDGKLMTPSAAASTPLPSAAARLASSVPDDWHTRWEAEHE